ncbi:ester cyclase [Streptomyces purpureus]|uniref:ester cyclase n=1 Tax=Streptomyces purpureus TaxID=1951 RepID=UPI00379BF07F
MGQAREAMDRLTEAVTTGGKPEAFREVFAESVVAVTPDAGEIEGREKVVEYYQQMVEAFPGATYESVYSYETGDTAIDEGFFNGRNTASLQLPTGETLPPTHKDVRVRSCDAATIDSDGKIVSYRLYFDQLDFLGQLGLVPEEA